jgi:hypothetical protein
LNVVGNILRQQVEQEHNSTFAVETRKRGRSFAEGQEDAVNCTTPGLKLDKYPFQSNCTSRDTWRFQSGHLQSRAACVCLASIPH